MQTLCAHVILDLSFTFLPMHLSDALVVSSHIQMLCQKLHYVDIISSTRASVYLYTSLVVNFLMFSLHSQRLDPTL